MNIFSSLSFEYFHGNVLETTNIFPIFSLEWHVAMHAFIAAQFKPIRISPRCWFKAAEAGDDSLRGPPFPQHLRPRILIRNKAMKIPSLTRRRMTTSRGEGF